MESSIKDIIVDKFHKDIVKINDTIIIAPMILLLIVKAIYVNITTGVIIGVMIFKVIQITFLRENKAIILGRILNKDIISQVGNIGQKNQLLRYPVAAAPTA